MRNKINFIIVLFLLVVGVGSILIDNEIWAKNVVEISDIQVSNSNPEINETIVFQFKISTKSEISDISVSIVDGKSAQISSHNVNYNQTTGEVSFSTNVNYYGEWKLNAISIWDVYGNVWHIYNESATNIPDGYMTMDMSAASAIVKGDPNDTTLPVIHAMSVACEKKEYKIDEIAKIMFDVTDNDEVVDVLVEIKGGNQGIFYTSATRLSGDEFFCDFYTSYAGIYEIVSIMAYDRSGNHCELYNSKYSEYSSSDVPAKDLSGATFNVESTDATDKEPPIINVKSMKVSKQAVVLREKNTISIEVADELPIKEIILFIKCGGRSDIFSHGAPYLESEGSNRYVFDVDSDYYGKWEVAGILATDENGNETGFYNDKYSEWESFQGVLGDVTQTEDLSAADFYVGIKDEKSGIFITGNGMDEDVKLNVKDLPHKGEVYDKMNDPRYKIEGFYEISVSGVYNHNKEKIRIEFSVKGKKDGEIILIRHRLKDGRMQDFYEPVQDGKVVVYVDEFSPFMLMSVPNGEVSTTTEGNITEENTTEEMITTTEEGTTEGTNTTTEEARTEEHIDNTPSTGDKYVIYVYVLLFSVIVSLVYMKNKKLN